MEWLAKWIKPDTGFGEICPVFTKEINIDKKIKSAKLWITALGVYEATLNGKRVSSYVLAPGWTAYEKRLQYQEYDITNLIDNCITKSILQVVVGKGWHRGRLPGWVTEQDMDLRAAIPAGLIAQIEVTYEDGGSSVITTDESWTVAEGPVRFSEIYDGETYDASFTATECKPAIVFDYTFSTLIPQEGEEIKEHERIVPARVFTTPKGETVIDFGQEITGYVEVNLAANAHDEVELSHAEVLDKEGNFYTENYRGAKAKYRYICKDGHQTYKPKLTFYGFRYIRVDKFPSGDIKPENFTAIAVYSDMERTGWINTSNPLLNRLFSNIIWGQKGNFLDVPTDCPQRDERLGWTGDAQVFTRTACINFDAERFFAKWLADMSAEQGDDGCVARVIPDVYGSDGTSAAWGDAACICPWEMYLAYGNKALLAKQFDMMKNWVDYISTHSDDKYLWTGGTHYGDWLGLDAKPGECKGSSSEEFIASAFYAYSTSLLIKAGNALGMDMSEYVELHRNIVDAFRVRYPEYHTQTEHVLAAYFKLAPDCGITASRLADMVKKAGVRLETGFVGTPYLLHVLSDYGYTELAYSLLFRTEYPSWLYPVTKGATTIWEHWDGIMENGDFWSKDMNSFNHYAYGAVADWIYGVAAGIKPVEAYPGYERVNIAPMPDGRLDWLKAVINTKHGTVRSEWRKENGYWRYEIETPVDARIVVNGVKYEVGRGRYVYFHEDNSSCE